MHVCPQCHRHIRESLCPFCGAKSDTQNQPGARGLPVGLARSALLVGALATAAASEACSPASNADGGDVFVSVDAAYGIPADREPPPPQDVAADTTDASEAPVDVVSVSDAYGIPADVTGSDR
jgi:hypothetical protein